MKKTTMIAIAIVFIVAICAMFFLRNINKMPVDIVRKHYDNESASFRLATVIEQVDVDSKTVLLFYYTANGGIANAILERGLLGYKVVNYSGEVAPVNNLMPTSVGFSSYGKAKSISWYVLYDQSITRAVIGGNESTIIFADNLKIYYLLSDFTDVPRGEFYNNEGELVWLIE